MAKRFLTDLIARYLGLGGATADATNPLSVRGQGILLDGDTGGHQLRLNKSATGDTGSLLFQTGFSGRAEFGLVASDSFQLKVSDDGSAFITAWAVAPDTAVVDYKVRPTILGQTALHAADTALDVRFQGLGLGGATPDGTNRLSINTTGALLNNAGTNIGLILNKNAAANDASVTLQSAFGTRALFGLLGNEDLTFKVSPDGSAFYDAFVVDKDTGAVATPNNTAFSVFINYDFYVAADTSTVVPFNNANHNDNGDIAAGVFTAPVNGNYEFHAALFYKVNASVVDSVTVHFHVNGTAQTQSKTWTLNDWGATSIKVASAMSVALSAGDTVDVRVEFETSDGYVEADTNTFFGRYIG